jgi:membrane-bound lytic murein transglycosylase D
VSVDIADNASMSLAPDAPPLRKMSLRAGRKETVASVARRYRVSPAQVAQWNGVAAGASFKYGQPVVVFVANKSVRTAHSRRAAPLGPPSTRNAQLKPKPKSHVRVAHN